MNKKGQITLFIILGIIIVVLGILFFIFKNQIINSSPKLKADDVILKVNDCLEETSKEVVLGVGQGGGYFYPTNYSTEFGIRYFYLNNQNLMPELEEIEKEISNTLNEKLKECSGNFSEFINYNSIDSENISSNVEIDSEKVYINVNYPIRIIKENEIINLKEFSYDLKVPLGRIYSAVSEMVSEEKNNQGICITCNERIALENNLNIEMIDLENQTVVFTVKDKNSFINEKQFEFIFANDYSKGL